MIKVIWQTRERDLKISFLFEEIVSNRQTKSNKEKIPAPREKSQGFKSALKEKKI